jgi:hypothetical protein
MTTEADKEQQQTEQDEQAGFDSVFVSDAPKEKKKAPEAAAQPEKKEPEAKVEEAKKEEAAPPAPIPELTAEDIASFRSAAQELPALKTQLRDAHGRIGALNDLLKQTREQKKEEGKAPVLTAVELKRVKEAYPELSEVLTADIGEALAALKPATSPEDIATLVKERVAEASHEERKQMLADEHPDWEDIKKGEELWKWIATLPKEDATKFQNSANPAYVAKQLHTFKAWRDGQSKAKEKSQERLEAAITPQGVPRSGKSTVSDEDAMRTAFEDQFK